MNISFVNFVPFRQPYSEGFKLAVLRKTVQVCYEHLDWLTGFLFSHVELCTFKDHVSLDDEMLIKFLFYFGVFLLVSCRESKTCDNISSVSSPMQ